MSKHLISATKLAVAGLASVCVIALFAGCNIFSIVDSPADDTQRLSMARACFDRGDLVCARKHYGDLSSANADVRASEEAFAILEEYGAGMASIMSVLQSGGAGASLFNGLAAKIYTNLRAAGRTPGQEVRVAIAQALGRVADIQSNTQLKGLTRFLTSVALFAEILAEDIGTSGTYLKTSLVTTPSTCASENFATCSGGGTTCSKPSGTNLTDTAASFDPVTTPSGFDTTAASVGMLNLLITQMSTALGSTELNAGGGFSSGIQSFVGGISVTPATASCYRQQLLSLGIGENQ